MVNRAKRKRAFEAYPNRKDPDQPAMPANLIRTFARLWYNIEPAHDKTNKMACAPSEDSDQPGHPPSLIRVFAIRMKEPWVLSCPLSAQRRLIRLGGCPGWSESSLGAHAIWWVLSCAASLLYNSMILLVDSCAQSDQGLRCPHSPRRHIFFHGAIRV